jgi:hypothetical protein
VRPIKDLFHTALIGLAVVILATACAPASAPRTGQVVTTPTPTIQQQQSLFREHGARLWQIGLDSDRSQRVMSDAVAGLRLGNSRASVYNAARTNKEGQLALLGRSGGVPEFMKPLHDLLTSTILRRAAVADDLMGALDSGKTSDWAAFERTLDDANNSTVQLAIEFTATGLSVGLNPDELGFGTPAPSSGPTSLPAVAEPPARPAPSGTPTEQLMAASPTPTRIAAVAAVDSPAPVATLRHAFVAHTDGEGVYVRRTTESNDKLKAWPEGTRFEVIGDQLAVSGVTWLPVRTPDGVRGFVPAQYTSSAPPTAVPTQVAQSRTSSTPTSGPKQVTATQTTSTAAGSDQPLLAPTPTLAPVDRRAPPPVTSAPSQVTPAPTTKPSAGTGQPLLVATATPTPPQFADSVPVHASGAGKIGSDPAVGQPFTVAGGQYSAQWTVTRQEMYSCTFNATLVDAANPTSVARVLVNKTVSGGPDPAVVGQGPVALSPGAYRLSVLTQCPWSLELARK